MPWEITIVGSSDQRKPLGSREDVVSRFAVALPDTILQRRPAPPPDILAQMPPILRENFLRPKLVADFETDDVIIQFFADDLPVLNWIGAEVRGNGNPIPALAALCVPNGWLVIDNCDKAIVNLSTDASPEWERFRRWRDKAIGTIMDNKGSLDH